MEDKSPLSGSLTTTPEWRCCDVSGTKIFVHPLRLVVQYYEDIKSSVDGEPSAPITIKGPSSAIVRGNGGMSVVSITHHHIHLKGFSVDGSGMGQEGVDGMDPDKYYRSLLHVNGDGRVETVSFKGHQHRCARWNKNNFHLVSSSLRSSCGTPATPISTR